MPAEAPESDIYLRHPGDDESDASEEDETRNDEEEEESRDQFQNYVDRHHQKTEKKIEGAAAAGPKAGSSMMG